MSDSLPPSPTKVSVRALKIKRVTRCLFQKQIPGTTRPSFSESRGSTCPEGAKENSPGSPRTLEGLPWVNDISYPSLPFSNSFWRAGRQNEFKKERGYLASVTRGTSQRMFCNVAEDAAPMELRKIILGRRVATEMSRLRRFVFAGDAGEGGSGVIPNSKLE